MNTSDLKVPETVAKAVQRIIDEQSAWVAMPNREVAEKIAFAAVVAAHTIVAKEGIDDYSHEPVSLSEVRADRNRNAAEWTPRDALIYTLRLIDRGEINPRSVVIFYDVGEGIKCSFTVAGDNRHVVSTAAVGYHMLLDNRTGN